MKRIIEKCDECKSKIEKAELNSCEFMFCLNCFKRLFGGKENEKTKITQRLEKVL